MSKIKVLRLVTGEELLGEVTETEGSTNYIIKNPVQLIVSMPKTLDASGAPTPQIGFAPWMFSMYTTMKKENPNGVSIQKQHVMFSPGVSSEIEAAYNELFAKVVIPKTSLILPS